MGIESKAEIEDGSDGEIGGLMEGEKGAENTV